MGHPSRPVSRRRISCRFRKSLRRGLRGTSGNAPDDAPHLHFEIAIAPEDGAWYGGTPVNPYEVLGRR
jgi:hypothetical protein